jgi:hypothetical protein
MTEPTYEFLQAENKRLTHLLKKRIYDHDKNGRLRMIRCENCVEMSAEAVQKEIQRIDAMEKAQRFIEHIQGHLSEGQVVVCKICGKSVDEISHQVLKDKGEWV